MKLEKNTRSGLVLLPRLSLAIMIALALFLAGQATCFATNVVLQWNPDTTVGVAGYKVYYQPDSATQPYTGTTPMDVKNLTTATITGLDPNHAYYFAVTAYNSAGLESAYSNIASIPETVPPTISLSAPATNAQVSGTVSVSAAASDNVGVTKVELYVNGTLQATDTTTPYTFSWNTLPLAAGTYTLTAKAYDAAGNIGQSGAVTVTVVNDSTPPTTAVTAPATGATISGTVAITASASDNIGVTKVEFYENGVLLSASNVAPYSYNWNTASVANGSYTLTVKAYDAAGNVGQSGTVTVTVNNTVPDTTAPTATITSPAGGATVSGTASIAATASDNVAVTKVEFYVNGTLSATDTAAPYTYSWNTSALANGSYTLTAKAYDAAGNVGQSGTVTVTVKNTVADTTAPTATITSPAGGATVSGTASIAATASDNVAVTKVEFYVNGTLSATDTAAPYTYSWNTSTLANGSYTLTVKAYDAAGNVGQSGTVTVTVKNTVADTTAPTVAITSPAGGATVSGTASIAATASDNVAVTKVEFYVNGTLSATDTAAPYTYSWNTSTLANGSYTLTAKAYDAAGNVGQSSTVSVTVHNATSNASFTIWPATTVPLLADQGADSAVELGLKFRSDSNGYITGVRFYKASTNTGSHVANLWTSTGTLLATATFTSETASGWQQVNFSTPVAITANTVYVASYHTNVGHYSQDQSYFAGKGVDSPPLHALADGVSGANGVYAYGATSTFPNQGWNSANYWVDPVFSAAVKPAIKGDVDGDGAVTVADAMLVLQAVTNTAQQTSTLIAAADVAPLNTAGTPSGDGKITIEDALLILRRAVGLVSW